MKTAKQHNAEQGVGEVEFHSNDGVGLDDTAIANKLRAAVDYAVVKAFSSDLQIGVWFNNTDFYRYRGKLPIVIESEIPMRSQQFFVISGCISCQLSKISGKVKRWLILPP